MREVIYHPLIFKKPSGTSRGVLTQKDSWFLVEADQQQITGIGEVSIIPGLNAETPQQVYKLLEGWKSGTTEPDEIKKAGPSLSFGLEMLELSKSARHPLTLFSSAFAKGHSGVDINGLIWMGTRQEMYHQIREKLEGGFQCIKLKIGAIDFEEEISLLRYIRSQYDAETVELRVDANGAFAPCDALEKLKRLSDFELHSIEQPIRQGQWEEMAALCHVTPLPIALDEELIGLKSKLEKSIVLDAIHPQYIILKPSLVGGLAQSDEWIDLAEERSVGWWATSALESNIGLNAIAQWTAAKELTMPQGLGTGGLYTNNIPSPLHISNAKIWHDPKQQWDLSIIEKSLL